MTTPNPGQPNPYGQPGYGPPPMPPGPYGPPPMPGTPGQPPQPPYGAPGPFGPPGQPAGGPFGAPGHFGAPGTPMPPGQPTHLPPGQPYGQGFPPPGPFPGTPPRRGNPLLWIIIGGGVLVIAAVVGLYLLTAGPSAETVAGRYAEAIVAQDGSGAGVICASDMTWLEEETRKSQRDMEEIKRKADESRRKLEELGSRYPSLSMPTPTMDAKGLEELRKKFKPLSATVSNVRTSGDTGSFEVTISYPDVRSNRTEKFSLVKDDGWKVCGLREKIAAEQNATPGFR